jgi:hypothetical protein
LANIGTKAMLNAPSAKKRRNMLGRRKGDQKRLGHRAGAQIGGHHHVARKALRRG